MPEFFIRPALHNDSDAVASLFDLYRQFYAQPANPTLAKQFIQQRLMDNQSVIFLAETSAHEIVGFCQLYPLFCSIEAALFYVVYDLFVAPHARHRGIARALLQTASHYAQAQGAARLELATAKTNQTAQALYESLGWQKDELFYVYTYSLKRPALS